MTRDGSRHQQVLDHLHERHGQLLRVPQYGVSSLAKDPAKVLLTLAIDREAERICALPTGLDDRLSRILDAAQALVAVHVVGLSIGDDEKQAVGCGLTLQ